MKRAVVRLPTDTVERIDELARKLRSTHPTRRYSRAAVVRALLMSALDAVEADAAKLARRPPAA